MGTGCTFNSRAAPRDSETLAHPRGVVVVVWLTLSFMIRTLLLSVVAATAIVILQIVVTMSTVSIVLWSAPCVIKIRRTV